MCMSMVFEYPCQHLRGGSEEHLAAHPQAQRLSSTRILRTTEVIVHTDGGSDAVGPGIGPKQTVDDRV